MLQGHQTSPELQWAIIRLIHFLDYERIAMCLNLSVRTVKCINTYFHTFGTIPNPGKKLDQKRGAGGKHLQDVDVEFLLGTIKQTPDLYLDELQEMLSVSCNVNISCSTIWRTLRRSGFTMKKMTRIAIERSSQKRLEYLARISMYQANQLVFVEESSVDR
ncbi:hypothetical protein BDN67DRAFT_1015314 [Paxillus ammoniavirescens]|nr:hypothetical protein BDN67DRAFT_1015314 [Paxillus ammoniavirescens]